jgi:hypothetical protein
LLTLLPFLALSLAYNVCAGCDGFDTTALNKLNYDLSGYGGDSYLAEGDYIVIDDMESYNDSNNIIWHTWLDGCGDANGIGGNGSGSCVYLAIDPCGPVHGGAQSMAYYYDNVDHGERCGGYSEIQAAYGPPADWASHGEKALVLWFRGSADNGTTPMWVVLESYIGQAMSFYGDNGEDPEDIKVEEWIEWNIKLSDFADGGVDLTNVTDISIGFGDGIHYVPDETTGIVYFDDIRLYPARCLVKYSPAADFTGDCAVNWQDLEIVARQWLHTGGGYLQGAADPNLEGDYEDCQAWGPDPPDGQTQVRSDLAEVVLSWQPGNCLGFKGRHFIYFSSDEGCVTNAPSPSVGWTPPACYLGQTPIGLETWNIGPLPMWTTYYWRIDEGCMDASVCKGQVWSFTTGCDLAVSDLNTDCLVNLEDYAALAGLWMNQTPPWPPE